MDEKRLDLLMGMLFEKQDEVLKPPRMTYAVLDAALRDDPRSRVACETLLTTGLVLVAGEITTETYIPVASLVREVAFRVRSPQGPEGTVRLAAVRQYMSRQCALVSYAEPVRREVFAQRYACGRRFDQLDAEVARHVEYSLATLQAAVEAVGPDPTGAAPAMESVLGAIRAAALTLAGYP